MVLYDPAVPVEYRPDDGSGVVYSLRVPRVADRPKFRHEITRIGGRNHSYMAMLEALKKCTNELLAGDEPERDAVLKTIEKVKERVEELFDELKANRMQTWGEDFAKAWIEASTYPEELLRFAEAAADLDENYRTMVADNACYPLYRGLAAARLFVRGWEGLDVEPKMAIGCLSDESLHAIPESHLYGLGAEVEKMIQAPESLRKNSHSPSGGPNAPVSSSGKKTRRQSGQTLDTGSSAGSAGLN